MKSQLLKLFAIAFVLGLVTIFASAGAANAQRKLSFAVPFDFHVGKDKLSAGKYELQKIGDANYLLRSVETKQSKILYLRNINGKNGAADSESLAFNRYGETYFLRSLFDVRGDFGKEMNESRYEKQVRKGLVKGENQLASEKIKPVKVSVNLSK